MRIFINLWLGGFCFIVFRRMKYGWWSENLCVSIPARASIVMVVTLQKGYQPSHNLLFLGQFLIVVCVVQ